MTLLRTEHVIEVECDCARHPAARAKAKRMTMRASTEQKAMQKLVDAGWTWDGRLYWCPICREREEVVWEDDSNDDIINVPETVTRIYACNALGDLARAELQPIYINDKPQIAKICIEISNSKVTAKVIEV